LDKVVIGKRLRRSREKLSLTREQFAEKVELSPQFIAQIENANRGMSAETLYKICTRLDISPEYILLGNQPMNELQLPYVDLLRKIPPDYSGVFEEYVKNFLDVIKIAERKYEL